MAFVIGLLTFILVLDCLVLIFLVLLQLPKKEAGAGLAFGGAATDALFGAGSGTVLTKITKYAAGVFFGLAILLAAMQRHYSSSRVTTFERELGQSKPAATAPAAPAAKPTAAQPVGTNTILTTTAAEVTNTPAPAQGTNVPAQK
jgi:preprotein translocase subunit SecG